MHKMAFAHVFGLEKRNGFAPFSYKFFVCIRVEGALRNLRRQDFHIEKIKIFVQDFVPIRTALILYCYETLKRIWLYEFGPFSFP